VPLTSILAQVAPAPGMKDYIDSLARTPISYVVMGVALLTVLRVAIFPALAKTDIQKRSFAYGLMRLFNELCDAFIYAGVFVFMLIRPFGVQAFFIPSGSMWPTLHINDLIVANKAIYRYTDPKRNDIVVFLPPKDAVQSSQIDADGAVKVNFIKRCIGLPGDVIELREGILYRNGVRDPDDDIHRHYSICEDVPRGNECQNFALLPPDQEHGLLKENFKLVKEKGGRLIPLNYTQFDANSREPSTGFGTQWPYSIADTYALKDPSDAQALENQPAQKVPAGYYLMMGDNRNGSFDSRGWGLVPRDAIIGRAEFIWFPITRLSRTR